MESLGLWAHEFQSPTGIDGFMNWKGRSSLWVSGLMKFQSPTGIDGFMNPHAQNSRLAALTPKRTLTVTAFPSICQPL